MDMLPTVEGFQKFSFLDLTCGAGQLLYTAMVTPYMRDMKYFVGGVNLPAQLGSAKRLADIVYSERVEGTDLDTIFTKRVLLVGEKETYQSLNPFTHIFIDGRYTDVGWMQRIAESINFSASVRFLITNCGENDLQSYGLKNFMFRASVDVSVNDRGKRVTYLMFERKDSYKDTAIGRLKKDPVFSSAMKAWASRSKYWFQ